MTEAARLEVTATGDIQDAERKLQSLGQQVNSFGSSVSTGIGLAAGFKAFEVGLDAITKGFGALKGSVIDFNQQLDMSRNIFTRYFEGNTVLADQFLNSLKRFAAETPFEFKDLSSLAVRLQAVGVDANALIPTIRAIGNAASASGSLSQESIGRIGLAIQQMIGKGKVQAEEMNQLIEGGVVDAWKILAKEVGVTEAQVRKMTEQGKISGEVMVAALRKSYENAGLMEQAAKSLTGALSTIRDVGTQAFAELGRSVYELATEGANALAKFLSTEEFQVWVQVGKNAMDGIVGGIRSMVESMAPFGEVVRTAFGQLTSGDFSGAFTTIIGSIQSGLQGVASYFATFADGMLGAGNNLITTFAAGILDGASTVLMDAVNTVASMIASFLVGNSPPAAGPLNAIREGGANTIAAWGEGASGAADAAVRPAVTKISGGLAELKDAGRDVDSAIRDIGRSISDLDSQLRDIKFNTEDIKQSYEDQLEPLEAQLKALQNVKDVEYERHKLELSLEEAQLRQAELAAQGDPKERARLQNRLDQLKAIKEQTAAGREYERIQEELAGSEKERLKDKLASSKFDREEADLKKKLKDAKGPEKDRIKDRLAELEIRKKLAEEDEKARQKKLKERQEDNELRMQELGVKEEMTGLVDKEEMARIKARQDEIKAEKEQMALAETRRKLEADIAALPIKQQIDEIKAAREADLKPLEEQRRILERQKAELNEQKQHYSQIKQEISAATSLIRDQEAAAKAAKAAAEKAAKEAALNKPDRVPNKAFTPDEAAEAAIKRAKEQGAKIAAQIRDGFVGFFTSNPLLSGQTLSSALAGAQAEGGIMAATLVLVDRLGSSLQKAVPAIATTLSKWTYAFLDWAIATAPSLLVELDKMYTQLITWIGNAATGQAGKLLEWATGFLAWVGPAIPELLGKLGTLASTVVEWIGANAGELADGFGKWALETIQWVAPKIPPLLAELGKMLISLSVWLVGTAAPAIQEKLLSWGKAIIEWVAPRIPILIAELGKLLRALATWIWNEGMPAFAKYMYDSTVQVGTALVQGIAVGIEQMYEFIKTSLAALATTIIESVKTVLGIASPSTVFAAIGVDIVQGLWDGIISLWDSGNGLRKWLEDFGTTIMTAVGWTGSGVLSWAADLLSIGRSLLTSIWDGLNEYWSGNLSPWFTALPDAIMAAFGWLGNNALSFAESLTSIGKTLLSTVWSGLDAYWSGNMGPWFANLGKAILAAFGVTGSGLSWAQSIIDAGKSVLQAMWDGMNAVFGSENDPKTIKGMLKQITDWIPQWIRDALSVKSPSRVMMEIGEHIMGGLVGGLQRKFPDLQSTISEAIKHVKNWEGFNLKGKDLIVAIQGMATMIGGDEFGKAAAAIAASETGGGEHLSEIGGTGAKGPFQFDPGGELRNFAKSMKMSMEEAGIYAQKYPMVATKWALENYLGDSLREGLSEGLRGRELANYGSRYGQRPYGDYWKRAGEWYDKLYGAAKGAIVSSRPGGTPVIVGEGGRDEAIVPLPQGWQVPSSQRPAGIGAVEVHRVQIALDDRTLGEFYVLGKEVAIQMARERRQ